MKEDDSMPLQGLPGLLIFAGSVILMFLIVPWERIKELLLLGIIIGLGIAVILIYLMQNTFGIWIFSQVDLVNIISIPLFLSAAWIPAVIVFSHLLAQYHNISLVGLVLIAFPVGATFIHWGLLTMGFLTYNNWSLFLTFLVSLAIHIGILAYLYYSNRLENLKLANI